VDRGTGGRGGLRVRSYIKRGFGTRIQQGFLTPCASGSNPSDPMPVAKRVSALPGGLQRSTLPLQSALGINRE
jgi:hypothetical protein